MPSKKPILINGITPEQKALFLNREWVADYCEILVKQPKDEHGLVTFSIFDSQRNLELLDTISLEIDGPTMRRLSNALRQQFNKGYAKGVTDTRESLMKKASLFINTL